MKKLILGALAFATGVIVEKKFNVADRVLTACGKHNNNEIAEDEEVEAEEASELADASE